MSHAVVVWANSASVQRPSDEIRLQLGNSLKRGTSNGNCINGK